MELSIADVLAWGARFRRRAKERFSEPTVLQHVVFAFEALVAVDLHLLTVLMTRSDGLHGLLPVSQKTVILVSSTPVRLAWHFARESQSRPV